MIPQNNLYKQLELHDWDWAAETEDEVAYLSGKENFRKIRNLILSMIDNNKQDEVEQTIVSFIQNKTDQSYLDILNDILNERHMKVEVNND